jgi:hypothetical protein
LFTKLQQQSTLLFLQTYPTPQEAMGASAEQIKAVLRQARHPQARRVAQEIVERLHQPHLQADAVTTRTKARLTLVLVRQLQPLIEQIAQYDKEIDTLFLTHEDHQIFESLPRAGQRLAPRLLAEIGDDRLRYQDESLLQALGGTSPVLFQSCQGQLTFGSCDFLVNPLNIHMRWRSFWRSRVKLARPYMSLLCVLILFTVPSTGP